MGSVAVLKLKLYGVYATRIGGYAKVTDVSNGDIFFKYSVVYEDNSSSMVSEDGSYLRDGPHAKDLVAELPEGARLYLFFKAGSSGVLSSKWDDYETD